MSALSLDKTCQAFGNVCNYEKDKPLQGIFNGLLCNMPDAGMEFGQFPLYSRNLIITAQAGIQINTILCLTVSEKAKHEAQIGASALNASMM